MHQQFNIPQLYALPTVYLYVLYLSENKLRLVPFTTYRSADKSLARPGSKQATATEDFEFHISYL